MRLIEQLEMANTIAHDIYTAALYDTHAGAAAALELLPIIGKSEFAPAARKHVARIREQIDAATWLIPTARAHAVTLVDGIEAELAQ